MAYLDYSGSTSGKVALLDKVKVMLAEIYTNYVAEIEAARDGESDLLTKLQAIETTITALEDGVEAEVTAARDGEASLLDQIDAIQSDIVDLQETSISELGLPALESGKALTNNGVTLSWGSFQAPLVSGTNIKTVNSTALTGSGDVAVQATLVSGTNIKTVGGNSVLGSGDLPVYEVSPYSLTTDARTSNTALDADDRGKLISCTTTFTQAFTDAATLGSGWWCYIKNTGTGVITLDPDGAETIDDLATYAMYPGEVRLVQCTGTAFYTTIKFPFYHTFTSTGTFVKPPGYSAFAGLLWAAGGGGSTGTTGGFGRGAGGGGGGCSFFHIPESILSATETVTIGAGGSGAEAVTVGTSAGSAATPAVVTYGEFTTGDYIAVTIPSSANTGGAPQTGYVPVFNRSTALSTLNLDDYWTGTLNATFSESGGNLLLTYDADGEQTDLDEAEYSIVESGTQDGGSSEFGSLEKSTGGYGGLAAAGNLDLSTTASDGGRGFALVLLAGTIHDGDQGTATDKVYGGASYNRDTVYGGGSGGRSTSPTSKGTSVYGGAGGDGGGTGTAGTNGTAPGGGGGGSYDSTAGDGARGEMRIWGIR